MRAAWPVERSRLRPAPRRAPMRQLRSSCRLWYYARPSSVTGQQARLRDPRFGPFLRPLFDISPVCRLLKDSDVNSQVPTPKRLETALSGSWELEIGS